MIATILNNCWLIFGTNLDPLEAGEEGGSDCASHSSASPRTNAALEMSGFAFETVKHLTWAIDEIVLGSYATHVGSLKYVITRLTSDMYRAMSGQEGTLGCDLVAEFGNLVFAHAVSSL